MTLHMTARYKDLLRRIDKADPVALCRDLVRIKSMNPPGDELEISQFIAAILREAGLVVSVVEHAPNRSSLVARLKGDGEVPAVLYCGHLDVMPVECEQWSHHPLGGDMAEGKLWGRGSTDMKGGIAAMITAAKVLASAKLPLKGDLVLIFTADEEVGQIGARKLATRSDLKPAQVMVISEPSHNKVYVAQKGQLWLEITTYGKTAHGAMPHLGQNAIMMMVNLLSQLDQLQVPYKEHRLLGGFTRSISTIHGGNQTNTVPDHCVTTVDQRTVPGQDHNAICRQVRALIADLTKRLPGFRASVRVISDLCPVETSPEEPVLRRFSEVVTAVTGKHPQPKGVSYTTDASILVPPLNVPMIICGPGNPDLAHQPNEHVEVHKLVESARIFTLAAAQLLT